MADVHISWCFAIAGVGRGGTVSLFDPGVWKPCKQLRTVWCTFRDLKLQLQGWVAEGQCPFMNPGLGSLESHRSARFVLFHWKFSRLE